MRLTLNDVTVSLGDHPVLRGASLDVAPGTRIALVGANGSGKSTLLLTLAGAINPGRGAVEVDGVALTHRRADLRAHRRRVQLVVQDPDDQLLSADVTQDVSFGPFNLGLPAGEVAERVSDSLGILGIGHLAERATHHLSYGERKRVVAAGAVALRPDVLLLDEPTAGLDGAGTDGLLDALARLHDRGTAIVLATHDVDLALAWADEVAVLADGVVTQHDPATALGDPALLARAHLRQPHALVLARALGIEPAPRSVADLVAHVHPGGHR